LKTYNDKRYWSAGDVEKFAYCPLNLYLALKGNKVEVSQGIEYQNSFFKKIKRAINNKKLLRVHNRLFISLYIAAFVLVITTIPLLFTRSDILVLIILIASLLSLLFGTAIYLLTSVVRKLRESRRLEDLILYFSIASLILILILYFYYSFRNDFALFAIILSNIIILSDTYSFYKILTTSEIMTINEIDPEKVYYMENGENPVLISERWRLRGVPDLILKEEDQLVPVEIKSSKKPSSVPFSHLMQLVAYAVLIEENYTYEVKYGILNYPNGIYKIEITEHLKFLLEKLLREMDQMVETGVAHRNHSNQGKCAGCFRKSMCPESLSK